MDAVTPSGEQSIRIRAEIVGCGKNHAALKRPRFALEENLTPKRSQERINIRLGNGMPGFVKLRLDTVEPPFHVFGDKVDADILPKGIVAPQPHFAEGVFPNGQPSQKVLHQHLKSTPIVRLRSLRTQNPEYFIQRSHGAIIA